MSFFGKDSAFGTQSPVFYAPWLMSDLRSEGVVSAAVMKVFF